MYTYKDLFNTDFPGFSLGPMWRVSSCLCVAQEWRSGFGRVFGFPLRHWWQSTVHQQGFVASEWEGPEGDGVQECGKSYNKERMAAGPFFMAGFREICGLLSFFIFGKKMLMLFADYDDV